jgi:Cys-Gly metallodipeptidase DUG1
MEKVYEYVEKNQNYFVDKLREVVAIPSVSGDVEHRPFVFAMSAWLEKELKKLGAR